MNKNSEKSHEVILNVLHEQGYGPFPHAISQLVEGIPNNDIDLFYSPENYTTTELQDHITLLGKQSYETIVELLTTTAIRHSTMSHHATYLAEELQQFYTLGRQHIGMATYKGLRATQQDCIGTSYGLNMQGKPFSFCIIADGIGTEEKSGEAAERIVQEWTKQPHWQDDWRTPDAFKELQKEAFNKAGASIAAVYVAQQADDTSIVYPYYAGDCEIAAFNPDGTLVYSSVIQNFAHLDHARNNLPYYDLVQHEQHNVLARSMRWNADGEFRPNVNKRMGLDAEDPNGISTPVPFRVTTGSTILLASDGTTNCMGLVEAYYLLRNNYYTLEEWFTVVSNSIEQRKDLVSTGVFESRKLIEHLRINNRLPFGLTSIPTGDNASLLLLRT